MGSAQDPFVLSVSTGDRPAQPVRRDRAPGAPLHGVTAGTAPAASASRRGAIGEAIAGMHAMLPAAVGLIPLGVAIGASIAASPLDPFAGWLGGPLLFAGSGHSAAIAMLGAGASWPAAVGGVLIVNARFALYSASLARDLGRQPRWFRWLAPYFLVEPLYAIVARRLGDDRRPSDRAAVRMFFLGGAVTLWLAWNTAIAFGLLAGPVIPADSPLDFVLPLMMAAFLAPALTGTSTATSAVVGGAVALALLDAAGSVALLLAAACGMMAGGLAARRAP